MLIKIETHLADVFISAIHAYQKYFSRFFKGSCIYTPSCSQYSIDAVQVYGVFKGMIFAIRRILRCRPPYKGGFDAVE